ncbi:MAG: phosphoadenosine phosphosulfate reductase family protein [Actinobacteria bacterium]|nr:phosphoadenosine phosphosulfate reductase family protein [Actinomycetota bacterium]
MTPETAEAQALDTPVEPEATTPLFSPELQPPGNADIDLTDGPAEDVLRYAVEQFHPRLYVASSFQKEASVILDMLLKIEPNARFFTIDTGNLFPETFEVWRKIEQRYDVKIDVYNATDFAPASILAQSTPQNTWAGEPDECCGKYKVAALQAALLNVDAWVTGLRREQAHTRAETRKVQWDAKNDRWKVCPLADWTEPTGPKKTSGATCTRTTFPTTSCTTGATPRSAARPAPKQARAARAAGPAATRPSAACTAETSPNPSRKKRKATP